MTILDKPRDQERGEDPQRERTYAPRFGSSAMQTALNLGPLASLPGSWKGKGFSVMWRPQNFAAEINDPPLPLGSEIKRYLMLNKTAESFDFHVVPGQVPNRGLQQGPPQAPAGTTQQEDINLYGLHYLQRVSDDDKKGFLDAGQALHLEPGLFMYVPANDNSFAPGFLSEPTIVRMGSIPHGVNVLMQGPAPSATPVDGPPNIPDTYPIPTMPVTATGPLVPPPGGANVVGLGIQPFQTETTPPASVNNEHVVPEQRISNDVLPTPAAAGGAVQSNGPYPDRFQAIINNPNSLLQDHIAHQEILGTITIDMSTDAVNPGISQIPFLGIAYNPTQPSSFGTPPRDLRPYQGSTTNNCYVLSASATFWLEWVKAPGEPHHYHNHHLFGLDGDHGPLRHLDPYLGEPTYLQLQYSQTVILVFNQVFWPHITVATMHLSNG
jgi:hypothetical protein